MLYYFVAVWIVDGVPQNSIIRTEPDVSMRGDIDKS